MIKPDAMKRRLMGIIIHQLESMGLELKKARLIRMDRSLCETFYQEHKEKAFFSSLVQFITSGPVFVMALYGEGAVKTLRQIMGSTDPAQASPGSLRNRFGTSIEKNCVHGSDSLTSAKTELALFFDE